MAKRRTALWVVVGVVAVFGLFAFLAWRQVNAGSRDEEMFEVTKQALLSQYSGSSITFAPYEKGGRVERSKTGFVVYGRMKCSHPDLKANTAQSPDGWLNYEVEGFVSGRNIWGNKYSLRRISVR